MTEKLLSQKYKHKQKRMNKMSYLESEPDFYNSLSTLAPIFSESEPESDDSESDFNSVFINLDICILFTLYLFTLF